MTNYARQVRERLSSLTETPTSYVLLLSFALFAGFSIYTSILYQGYWQGGTDFGSYIHMFETTLSGKGWLLQGKYRANHPGGSYWGAHFSLTLLFYMIPYAIVSSPYTLLVSKAVVVAASIIMFWFVARDHLGGSKTGDRVALAAVVAYSFNPFLWGAWVFDFQEQSLIPLLGFGAYYAYRKDRYIASTVLFILVALTNEFEIYIVGGFILGLLLEESFAHLRGGDFVWSGEKIQSDGGSPVEGFVWAIRNHLTKPILALLTTLASLLGVKFLSSYVISRFSLYGGIPLTNIADPIVKYVSSGTVVQTRTGVGELINAIINHPSTMILALIGNIQQEVKYMLLFFAPVLFAVILSPAALLALAPYFGTAWVLTDIGAYQYFVAHYPFYLLPYVFIGFVRVLDRYNFGASSKTDESAEADESATKSGLLSGVGNIGGGGPRQLLIHVLLIVALIGAASSVTGHFGYRYETTPEVNEEHSHLLEEAIDEIPYNASLLTQNAIYPHVAERPNATFVANANFKDYVRKFGLPSPKYIFVDYNISHYFNTRSNVANRILRAYSDRIGSNYQLWRWQNGVAIYKKGYEGPPKGITEPYRIHPRQFNITELATENARIENASLTFNTSGRNISPGETLWFGPYKTLPPGNYRAIYRIQVTPSDSAEAEYVVRLDVAAGKNHEQLQQVDVRSTNGWTNVTVNFTLDRRRSLVEFRGISGKVPGNVSLRWIRVEQQRNYSSNSSVSN